MSCDMLWRTGKGQPKGQRLSLKHVSVSLWASRWRSRYWNPIHFWRPLATLEPSGAFWRRLPSQTPSLESLESWESLWKREQMMETCEPYHGHQTICPHCNTLPKLRYCILSALHIFASCESTHGLSSPFDQEWQLQSLWEIHWAAISHQWQGQNGKTWGVFRRFGKYRFVEHSKAASLLPALRGRSQPGSCGGELSSLRRSNSDLSVGEGKVGVMSMTNTFKPLSETGLKDWEGKPNGPMAQYAQCAVQKTLPNLLYD